jgi:hypothetical protein
MTREGKSRGGMNTKKNSEIPGKEKRKRKEKKAFPSPDSTQVSRCRN